MSSTDLTGMPTSISEDHGLALLSASDLAVYSVGISTGGAAEIRMAKDQSVRHIIATTIDKSGAAFAEQLITQAGFDERITVKIEDVSSDLPYEDGHFDYVYARLVLHYLAETQLKNALAGLFRITKPHGRLFVVVRSTLCPAAQRATNTYDPATHLTTCVSTDASIGKKSTYSRFFHTPDSIIGYVAEAGFAVEYATSYEEQLFRDFERTQASSHADNVIELLAVKS